MASRSSEPENRSVECLPDPYQLTLNRPKAIGSHRVGHKALPLAAQPVWWVSYFVQLVWFAPPSTFFLPLLLRSVSRPPTTPSLLGLVKLYRIHGLEKTFCFGSITFGYLEYDIEIHDLDFRSRCRVLYRSRRMLSRRSR